MKKRLFSLVLALALCMGLTVPAIAATTTYENASDFGASTWRSQQMFPLDGINASSKDAFEQATGLTVFSQKEVFQIGGSLGFAMPKEYLGLKSNTGTIVLPAEFTSLEYIGENRIVARRSDRTQKDSRGVWIDLGYGVYTTSGVELFPPSAGSIAYANYDKRTFLIKSMARNGNTDSYNSVQEEFILGSSIGLYDWDFQELLSPKTYGIIDYMQDGYYRIQEGHRDSSGTCYWSYGVYKYGVGVVIPCQREIGISYLGSDMFRVRTAPFCYGAVDGNGKQVLPSIYAGIRSYSDGYFAVAIPRNELYRQQAVQSGFPSAAYEGVHGAGDISNAEGYLTMGIVDSNGTVYSSFDHDLAYIGEDGRAYLKTNGGHEIFYPYPNAVDWNQLFFNVKSYDVEAMSLSSPTPTGKTITDILRERGIAVDGTSMPSAPVNSMVGGFTDVKESDYFADAVLWAVEKQITSGTSKTTFFPDATCSKAQILTFLWRANGSPEPTAANPFTDGY